MKLSVDETREIVSEVLMLLPRELRQAVERKGGDGQDLLRAFVILVRRFR